MINTDRIPIAAKYRENLLQKKRLLKSIFEDAFVDNLMQDDTNILFLYDADEPAVSCKEFFFWKMSKHKKIDGIF